MDRLAALARAESWTHEEFLAASLQREVAARDSQGGKGRTRAAPFPARNSLEEFGFDHARGLNGSEFGASFPVTSGFGVAMCAAQLCRAKFADNTQPLRDQLDSAVSCIPGAQLAASLSHWRFDPVGV